jgi:hypothetical protein
MFLKFCPVQATEHEIEEELSKLKNNKSTGDNGIPAEILKNVVGKLKNRVSALIKRIFQEERKPQQLRSAVICLIPKKGNRTNWENYRGISLLDVTYKVMTRVIIRNRLSLLALIGEYQGGVRKGRSTTDQIFTLKMLYRVFSKLTRSL